MKGFLFCLIVCALLSFCFSPRPVLHAKAEKHYGKVFSILGQYEGNIHIKLNEENEDMIEIELEAVTEKSKGSKKKSTSSVKLNAAAIKSIEIDSIVYNIRSIEYENGKYYKNCCIKEINKNPRLTLYAWGSKTDASSYSLLIKGYTYPKILKEVGAITTMFIFNGCNEFREKMRAKQSGYFLEDAVTAEERLKTWTRWIEETKECIKT